MSDVLRSTLGMILGAAVVSLWPMGIPFLAVLSGRAQPAAQTVMVVPAGQAVPAAWEPLQLPVHPQNLLQTGRWDTTPKGFRIVALSFIADGCVAQARQDPALREAARACVDRCLVLAERTRPAGQPADPVANGLWSSHWALLMGARDQVGPCPDPARHEALVAALAERSRDEPTHHLPSYPGTIYRWPADQTATLAALARFDRAHGTHWSEEPVQLWRSWILEHALDARLGLPWSEATGRAPGARIPRGCALSWQTRYLAEIDPALARQWWERYRNQYLVDRGLLVGFREWPPGRGRPADADSGPIVAGVGASATALAIAASRTQGESALAVRLEATAGMVGTVAKLSPALRRQADTILATAIRYLGAQSGPLDGRGQSN